jgi:signal transduction histidine kinase
MFNKFLKKRASSSHVSQEPGKTPDPGRSLSENDRGREGNVPKRRERIKLDLLIHDLKVPLAVIEAGLISMLERQEKYGPLTEWQQKVLTRALRNTKVTQGIVKDALELGRSREGIVNLTECRISDLVMGTLVEVYDLVDSQTADEIKKCSDLHELIEKMKERDLELYVDENLWCQGVHLDETKISQILRNLLNNALKYKKKLVELKIDKTDVSLVLSVRDDGEGISSAYHKKIFDCYFQIDAGDSCPVRGHGLGLAGVMVLVEDLGGKLFLDSDEGQGARFLVKVPLST